MPDCVVTRDHGPDFSGAVFGPQAAKKANERLKRDVNKMRMAISYSNEAFKPTVFALSHFHEFDR